MVGIGIVIPVLASLFINGSILTGSSFATKTLILGLLIAVYPLAQFFGAPILGALSDKHGRKKILLVSLIGTFIGYVLFAIGIITNSLWVLFLSRLIDGFTGGNISVAIAAISDISDEKDKVKRFGLVGMAFGLGVIVGPVIGGILSDSEHVSWFNYALPFWFAAFLTLVNIVHLLLLFDETLLIRKKAKISLLTGIKNIKKAFNIKMLRNVFLFSLFLGIGFSFFTQFFQVFLIEKFDFSESGIGTFFAFMGLCIAITQGLIVRPLSKKFKPAQILTWTPLLLAIAIFAMILPGKYMGVYLIVPFIAITNGLTLPNTSALISSKASKEDQGEIFGINQSFQSLSMAIPAILAGIVAGFNFRLPIIIGSLFILFAWFIFLFFVKKDA